MDPVEFFIMNAFRPDLVILCIVIKFKLTDLHNIAGSDRIWFKTKNDACGF